jgi:hypothetical protein
VDHEPDCLRRDAEELRDLADGKRQATLKKTPGIGGGI